MSSRNIFLEKGPVHVMHWDDAEQHNSLGETNVQRIIIGAFGTLARGTPGYRGHLLKFIC